MKFFSKKEKGNNSVKELLKKLKRHDTKVVAIAVIIALALSAGLIYISTPIVVENETQELEEKEREHSEDTANKLGEIDKSSKDTVDKLNEINSYLTELDKVVTSNQQSLNSISEKNDGSATIIETGKTTNTINEKVTELDTKLKEVHTNIDGTTTKIENLKTIIEQGDVTNKEQLEKDFATINTELTKIKSDYEKAQKKTKELMDKLQKEMSSENKALDEKTNQNHQALLEEIASMNKSMEESNTESLSTFKKDLAGLSGNMTKLIGDYQTLVNSKLENLDSAVNTKLENLDSAVNNKFENLDSSMNSKIDSYNNSVNSKLEGYNNNVNSKLEGYNNNVNSKLDGYSSSVDTKMSEYNNSVNSKFDTINVSVNGKLDSVNQSMGTGFGDLKGYIKENIDSVNAELKKVFQSVSDGKKLEASTLLTYGISVKQDASFKVINAGIDELGKQKVALDNAMANAVNSAAPGKIMAGQSIVIGGTEIAGQATSDASAGAGDIKGGATAYVNGQMVVGTMSNNGYANVILSNDNRSQTLPAGYYDGITISADISGLPTNVTYTHHVHSHESTTETVVDNSFASGSEYGEETSSQTGGCYLTPIYGPCGGSGVATEKEYGGSYYDTDGDGKLDRNVFHVGICDVCHSRIFANSIGERGNCTNQYAIKGYTTGCGYVSGQIISAVVNY